MYKIYYQTDTDDWQQMCKELNELRNHYNQNVAIMSEYDKQEYQKMHYERSAILEPQIRAGAIGAFDEAHKALKLADINFDNAIIAEIARWDVVQLNAAMASTKQMVDSVLSQGVHVDNLPGELTKLLDEAKISGDIHKLRGVAEVLKGLKGRGGDLEESMALNRVSIAAQNVIADLRTTDTIKTAQEKQNQAADVFEGAYKGLERAYRAIHAKDPMAGMPVDQLEENMARVVTNRDTGETKIYDSYDEAWKADRGVYENG